MHFSMPAPIHVNINKNTIKNNTNKHQVSTQQYILHNYEQHRHIGKFISIYIDS